VIQKHAAKSLESPAARPIEAKYACCAVFSYNFHL